MQTYGPRTRAEGTAYSPTGAIHLRAMDDVVVENFHERREAGELINNPLSSISYFSDGPTLGVQSCGTEYFYVSNGVKYFTGGSSVTNTRMLCRSSNDWTATKLASRGNAMLTLVGGESFSSNQKTLLNTSVDGKIGSGLAQIYVTLYESKKTLNMIRRAVNFLRLPLADAKRLLRVTRQQMLDPRTRDRVIDKAGDLWLEGRYGWRPFVHDIMNMTDALLKGGRSVRYTARGTMKNSFDYHNPIWKNRLANANLGRMGWEYKMDIIQALRGGSTVDYAFDTSASKAFLFGTADILGSSWEAVKYSFVIDWFLNIGDMLKSLQAYVLVDKRIGWTTEILDIRVAYKAYPLIPDSTIDGNNLYTWNKGTWQGYTPYFEHLKSVKRVPRVSFAPSLGFRFNVDALKVIDSLALLKKGMGIKINFDR